jgi:hypothetical protein
MKDFETFLPVITALLGFVGAGFWFKRFIIMTDKKLDSIERLIKQQSIHAAVTQTKQSKIESDLNGIVVSVGELQTIVAKLETRLDIIWGITQTVECAKTKKMNEESK